MNWHLDKALMELLRSRDSTASPELSTSKVQYHIHSIKNASNEREEKCLQMSSCAAPTGHKQDAVHSPSDTSDLRILLRMSRPVIESELKCLCLVLTIHGWMTVRGDREFVEVVISLLQWDRAWGSLRLPPASTIVSVPPDKVGLSRVSKGGETGESRKESHWGWA